MPVPPPRRATGTDYTGRGTESLSFTVGQITRTPEHFGNIQIAGNTIITRSIAKVKDTDQIFIGISIDQLNFHPDVQQITMELSLISCYILSDGTGNDDSTGKVSISITRFGVGDDPPLAEDRTLTVDEDNPGTNLGLLEPASLDSGETLTNTIDQIPLAREGVIDTSATDRTNFTETELTPKELPDLKFIPIADYDGEVADFIYTVSDGTELEDSDDDTGTVGIQIIPIDDAPNGRKPNTTDR